MNNYGLHIPLETVLSLIPGTSWNRERKNQLEILAAQAELAKLMPQHKRDELALEKQRVDLLGKQVGLTGRGQWFDLLKSFGGPVVEHLLNRGRANRHLDIMQMGHELDFLGRVFPSLWKTDERPSPYLYLTFNELASMPNRNPAQEALFNKLGGLLGIDMPAGTQQPTPPKNISGIDEAVEKVTRPGKVAQFFENLFKRATKSPSQPPTPPTGGQPTGRPQFTAPIIPPTSVISINPYGLDFTHIGELFSNWLKQTTKSGTN